MLRRISFHILKFYIKLIIYKNFAAGGAFSCFNFQINLIIKIVIKKNIVLI